MQIAINSKGAYIRRKSECFEIKVGDIKQDIAAKKVSSILITTSVLISSDALKLANEHNIDVIFLDKYGNPFSRVWYAKFGSTAFIRRRQLEYSSNEKGVDIAKKWIQEKFDNCVEYLLDLKKTRENKAEKIDECIIKITDIKLKLNKIESKSIDEIRNTIMGLEGSAGRSYFRALSFIIPEKYEFKGRSRNPAKDEFNSLLNYGYGILYSRVERACILAGLDPYIGFIHTDDYGKISFVFDIIEIFRIHIDRVVMKLFSKRMVKKEMFQEVKNGMTLDKKGKELIIEKYNEEMEKTIRYRNRNIKKKNMIEYECHRIANGFIGRNKDVNMVDL